MADVETGPAQRKRSQQEIVQAAFPQMMAIPGVLAIPVNPPGLGGSFGQRDQLLGGHLGVVVLQAWPAGAVDDDRVERDVPVDRVGPGHIEA